MKGPAKMASKSVVITGASDGIGRGMALSFARRGYKIGLIARRAERLSDISGLCREAGSPAVEYVSVDATQSEAFRSALAALDEKLGGTDIFVANAGFGDVIPADEDGGIKARQMVTLNVTAAIDGLEFMKARMVRRGSGRLVGLSSVAGSRGLPGAAVYSATKAALKTYLEGLRVETRRLGVRITTISPGFIATAPNLGRDQPMPFLMAVDKASEIFVRKIVAGKRSIVAPWQYSLVIWFLKHLPDFLYEATGLFYSDSGIDKRKTR